MLVRLDNEDEDEVWIPLSQLADPDDYDVGDVTLSLSVTQWFADQEGLEVEEE